ncbi:unnamed protein product [Ilex paraguariensis]|uniref:Charged multivesicular body protein 7 n=1 Tax=Ilex paraguariensis TaxID=185542 RepID=A0ABC8RBA3_9AQUA
MYDAGDILRCDDLVDTTSGRLSQIFRRIVHLTGLSWSSTPVDFTEDHLILWPLLKEKAAEVVKVLSENHWTSSCIITTRKFQEICGGSMEASAVLCHLSGCRKAKYLVINKQELMEGVKVSLSPGTVCATTSLDYNILYLICTLEKLQQQLDVIDERCEKSRKSGLASLKSGNKVVALRHARELKLASQSREKCTTLSNRVEEVLRVIADAECSKKVSEAIQIGARAIKENKISLEEVELCLQELDESLDSQKQVEIVLGSTSSYAATEDEDLEEELKKLELEVGTDCVQEPVSETGVYISVGEARVSENSESLSKALSNLKLTDRAAMETVTQDFNDSTRNYSSKDLDLEAA